MRVAAPPSVLLHVPGQGWLCFRQPSRILIAWTPSEVEALLADLRQAVQAVDGRWAAGFFAYEATPAFDPALAAHPPRPGVPSAWWALFDAPERVETPPGSSAEPRVGDDRGRHLDWRPQVSQTQHAAAVAAIRRHIAAGDTYQVNLTFPLEARTTPKTDPYRLFLDWTATGAAAALSTDSTPPYAAWIDTASAGCADTDLAVASMSPELFFHLHGDHVVSRPMKGTSPRGRWCHEDEARAAELRSEKNRAENLMITDMVRNDLGKVSVPGSVQVTRLFAIETYAEVHQLTSEVSARLEPGRDAFDLLWALFPCASITGAPKARTSHFIRELEPHPRGVYTGCAGFFAPDGSAQLSVLIRTALFDRCRRLAWYGTGGGVVWDSRADSEYDEARTKTRVLRRRPGCAAGADASSDFRLLETMLWRPASGFFLLPLHLERLADSARFFGFAADVVAIEDQLHRVSQSWSERTRARLWVDRLGRAEIQGTPEACPGRHPLRLALDSCPVDVDDVFLFHKTTCRAVFDAAAARHPDADDVLLWNVHGELTESTRANLIVERDGRRLTPPRRCGLLAGTYRRALLERGSVEECVLSKTDLASAERVLLVNSVRGFQRVGQIVGL